MSALVSTTDRERGALNRLDAKTPERFPLRNIERRAPRFKAVEIRSPRVGVLSALECVKQAPALAGAAASRASHFCPLSASLAPGDETVWPAIVDQLIAFTDFGFRQDV